MKKVKTSGPSKPRRPALSPEARENQMISYAMDLVEQRLLDGTASSQETTHFLKLATSKAKLENQLLEAQAQMAIAKKEVYQSQKRYDEQLAEAMKAIRTYSGNGDPDDY